MECPLCGASEVEYDFDVCTCCGHEGEAGEFGAEAEDVGE